ncbi:MAG: tetratricopeptide repeat protein [bacterium]
MSSDFKKYAALFLLCLLSTGCSLSGMGDEKVDRLFTEAGQLSSGGQLLQAEQKYIWVIQHRPMNPRPYNNLGNIYSKKGEIDKARMHYKKALELNSGYLIARINLAVLLLRQEETENAFRLLQEGMKEYPESAELHNGLGICEVRRGNIQKAIQHFRKAIDIQGSNPMFYNNLAYAYTESNEFLNEALKLSKDALKAEPQNAIFLDTLGWVYYKKGIFDQSVEYLRKALDMKPGEDSIRSHLVTVYRWIGEDEKAVNLIKEGAHM